MVQARGNSIYDASEKMVYLLMGCSREEGLHLYSSHECKICISSLFGLKKKNADVCVDVFLLFCCPAEVLHVLCQATPSLLRAARLYGFNVTNPHGKYSCVIMLLLNAK